MTALRFPLAMRLISWLSAVSRLSPTVSSMTSVGAASRVEPRKQTARWLKGWRELRDVAVVGANANARAAVLALAVAVDWCAATGRRATPRASAGLTAKRRRQHVDHRHQ